MSKYAQGIYTPLHPEKYVGTKSIKYRSSWEMAMMRFFDNHPSVIQWASESIQIPYRNPLTGKNTIYVPDFFVYYQDANGQNHGEIIEVKPSKETSLAEAKSPRDKAAAIVNAAKWQAAQAFCKRQGLTFRIVTEQQMFFQGNKR